MFHSDLLQDVRYALRTFRKAPGFTAAAAVAIALGIGANTAVFSVVDAVMFRPLPFANPERLVMIWETRQDINPEQFADPKAVRARRNWLPDGEALSRWRERNHVFEEITGFGGWTATLTGQGEPERPKAALVTPGFFKVFGIQPLMGRTFLPEEDRPGDNRVILLGHALWQRRFASDPKAIGKTMLLDGAPHTIVGVMPADVRLVLPNTPAQPAFWGPSSLQMTGGRKFVLFHVVGRLKPGVSIAQAHAEMDAIAAGIAAELPRRKGRGVNLTLLSEEISGPARPAMIVLLAAVGCVLLIACANVANLLLARAAVRRREIGLRVVLGAGRRRLLAQTLTESVALGVMGGSAGALLAWVGVKAIVLGMPAGTVPRMDEIGIDARVLLFTVALSVGTGLLFGLAPAIDAARWSGHRVNDVIKEAGRSTPGRSRRLFRDALVIAEIALTLVLMTGAGLLIRSFMRLRNVEMGFHAENVLTVSMMLMDSKYPQKQHRAEFAERVLERVQTIPGVLAAAVTNSIPVRPAMTASVSGASIEGLPEVQVAASYRTLTPDYFKAMGIPLKQGRIFSKSDAKAPVVIVNEAFVKRYLAAGDVNVSAALGRRVRWRDRALEIVGVAGDIRFNGPASDSTAEMYLPHTENLFQGLALVVRTGGEPMRFVPLIRDAVKSVDPDQPLELIATMDQNLSDAVARPRFHMTLVSVFAGLALALAAVGVYALIAYSVTQRTHEIGLRMALGAERSSVLRMVLRHALVLGVVGVALGLAGAVAATRILSTLLFEVKALDVPTFAAVSVLLIAITVCASWLPARRATRVDPMVALRYE